MIDIIKRLRKGEAHGVLIPCDDLKEAASEIERLREFVVWIDTWISNPARSYSHDALEGLFGMTRDKISALAQQQREAKP